MQQKVRVRNIEESKAIDVIGVAMVIGGTVATGTVTELYLPTVNKR